MSDNDTLQPLWSARDLAAALRSNPTAALPAHVSGVSIDSRTLAPGDLFFAIRGESDGHAHVASAFSKGAAAAVVEAAQAGSLQQYGPLLAVDDTLRALEDLGRAARDRSAAKIVAVTGSVGKTSTKEALRAALSPSGMTHASAASYNNHWGVPLTLARLHGQARFGVFEIGMNHAGEITPLTRMVRPHVAIITTIAPVHIEFFPSIEAIADAKAEIFAGIEQGGIAVLPRDVPQFEQLKKAALASRAGHIVSFGETGDADARLVSWGDEGASGSLIEAEILGRKIRYRLGTPGRHLVGNSLAVLLAVQAVGADVELACDALSQLSPPTGRGARHELLLPAGSATLIDESYNANPVSMKAAIELLSRTTPGPGGRRVAVLGDMLELGADASTYHAELAGAILDGKIDVLACFGLLMRSLHEKVSHSMISHWAATSVDAPQTVANLIQAGDVVMVKASNGTRLGPVVTTLKQRFGRLSPAAENSKC